MANNTISERGAPSKKNNNEGVFGVNEMRLSLRQWIVAGTIVLVTMWASPHVWKRCEQFTTGPEYRIPYSLSADYWLYQRRADSLSANAIPVIGDSVVWGEYVLRDGTLSTYLSHETGRPGSFANCGVNGVFPLALEGLIGQYGQSFHDRKIVVQCNLLWMSSPKADLSIDSEETFNHTELVSQKPGAIPCYRADAATRMGAFMETHIGFYGLVNHINTVYYGQESLPKWTLNESDEEPLTRPNAWKNPLSVINFKTPTEPEHDPARGPASRRHKAWNAGGAAPSHFEWVDLNKSLQWGGFRRLVTMLKGRGNNVLVVLGPFNEHMVAQDQLPQYNIMKHAAVSWFQAQGVTCIVPNVLPTELYADASHPLTEGYALLAHEIYTDALFTSWINSKQ